MDTLVDDLCKIVTDLTTKGIVLNGEGIFTKKAQIAWRTAYGEAHDEAVPFTREEIEYDLEAITKAIRLIPFLVISTTRKGLVGSYGLKHVIEKHIYVLHGGTYICNGSTILAMLYLKYTIQLSKEANWNCTFNCNYIKSDGYETNFRGSKGDVRLF